MTRRIHRRFVIALWVLAFGFFAGIAQGRLGYDYRDNLMFYGRPVETNIDEKTVTWRNNGFATCVKFDIDTGKAKIVSTSSNNWSDKIIDQWLALNTRTFGKEGRDFFVHKGELQVLDGALVMIFLFKSPTGEIVAAGNQKVRGLNGTLTITDLRK